MAEFYEGTLIGQGLKFGIVISRFNEMITNRLLGGARDGFLRHGVAEEDIDTAWTPGCFELPLVAKKMAESGKYDAVVCLGCVIRGSTPHFEYVASAANRGISNASLQTGVPVIQGLITADNLEQAIERAGTKQGNRGFAAASTAIEMAQLMKKLS